VVVGCTGEGTENMDVKAAPDVKLLTVPQVAVALNLSDSKIWHMVASGELDSVKIGWSRRVPASTVDEYIKSLQTAGDAA
jgi:excisionase family DNA binding protein